MASRRQIEDAYAVIRLVYKIANKLERETKHKGDAADLYHIAEYIERAVVPIELRK